MAIKLTKDFEDSLQKEKLLLLDKFPQLTPYEDAQIPMSKPDRYIAFKEYAAYEYFLEYKYYFLQDTDGEIDVMSIQAQIQDIEKIRKHPALIDKRKRVELYGNAVSHMYNVLTISAGNMKYETETNILYNVVLHEEGYFNKVLLPDDVFNVFEGHPVTMAICDIYAKYFIFYDYLKSLLSNNKQLEETKPDETSKTVSDLFKNAHTDKFEQIITILSSDPPVDIQKLHPNITQPFIIKDNGNIIWKGEKGQLADMLLVCSKRLWLKHDIDSYTKYNTIVNTLFGANISKTSQASYKQFSKKVGANKHVPLFEKLFSGLN